MGIFQYLTPAVYGLLVIVWGYILVFYLRRLWGRAQPHRLLYTLLLVLSIAALSTFFESLFFGLRYTALMGFLPITIHEALERPEFVIVPKGLNLLAGVLIVAIILRRWLPQEEEERRATAERARTLESMVQERTRELEAANRQLTEDLEERTRLASALRESDARFRAVFEYAGLGVVVVDPALRIVSCNAAIQRMLGYSHDELIALGIEGISHPDDLEEDLALADSLRQGAHVAYQLDKRYIHKNGSIVWGSLTGTIVRDEHGGIAFGIGMVEDITERRNAEAAVRESESLLRTFFDSAPFRMGVVELEEDDVRFVKINAAFAASIGKPVEEIAGRSASEIGFDRETVDVWRRHYQMSVAERRVVQFENRRHINGRWDTLVATVAPIDGCAGSTPRLLFVVEDVTERKQAEEELAQQRVLMDTIVRQAADGVIVSDHLGMLLFTNEAARRIARIPEGVTVDAFSPEIWGTAYDENGVIVPATHWSIRVALRGEVYQGQAARMVRRDGSHYDILVSAAPVRDAHGAIVAAVATFTDITERRQAEDERRKLEAQMQHAQKLESLGVLAGGIAHDFNNLLVGILGNADLALSELSQHSPASSYLHDVIKAAQRASDLSRQMLAYSGKGRFIVEPVNLNDIIQEMAHLLEVSISKNAVLRFNLAEPLPWVEADATQIRQVVMNLITNASDALENDVGTISISTAGVHCTPADFDGSYSGEQLEAGDYVVLEVMDTGHGMDPDTIERVFEPFFTTKFTGRGLGLSAVLGIVRGHGGALQVKSTLGDGSLFAVFLPARSAPPVRAPQSGDRFMSIAAGGTVLLVDDDAVVRDVTLRMLERAGFAVVTAADGEEAVARFTECADTLSCVFLDLTMPKMDGEKTFKALKAIRDDVPVVLVSGYSDRELSDRYSSRGFAGFLQKPFRKDDLYEMIRSILG
jgi:PAS domain S-box-containing protein